ncbi:nucleoside ABC transporter ATP-binding protein [Roseibium hamelinense]|uniref:Nucleoside ABC transporter ATP-binding protein n=1 Tax=Roseibium hamelinense TaxID=150831 RepID=A0A562THF6_9HYPH|nr:ABC transporter ATP-binding protein [Roseibium hamelinense]MTI45815.1 ABC transporter ATP-binding protein [Roseibium hamelinense]TWI93002.1 nucleoside ABC transporter ATP-binding protein [Roseibium hamelinense]
MAEAPEDKKAPGARQETGDLLDARGLTKRFGDILANDRVDLAIHKGEIHALLGENGAGKSTLVKMFYGSLEPDGGTILWQGKEVRIDNPAAARALGIGMVFQHFSLFEALTVVENIALALPNPGNMAELAKRIEAVSNDYGLPLNPKDFVADLPVGIRQRIEIVRCLLQEPQLIIMDEPTSVLTPQEADRLFLTLQRLASEGCAVLYISHRLEEVQRICHHATILRHGQVVRECDPTKETAGSLAQMMVGSEILGVGSHTKALSAGEPRLGLKGLSAPAGTPFATALNDINLDVRAGEVVAIAGVAGNGQGELFDALSGEMRVQPGMVVLDGEAAGARAINWRRKKNAAFVPEERLGHGAVPGLKLSQNVVLTRHATKDGLIEAGMVSLRKANDLEKRIKKHYDVRMSHDDPEARSLSGGNLQKFVMGRELDRKPGILVVNQPTWGVDAGAAALIRQGLIDLAREGSAVLVISQDLDEIFQISDRIAVISRGYLSAAEPAAQMTRERVGLLMAGGAETQGEAH